MTSTTRRILITILGALGLLLPPALLIVARYPRMWAPFPVALVFPLFFTSEMQPHARAMALSCLVFSIPAILFLVVGRGLFRGHSRTPLFTLLIAVGLGACNGWWLFAAWSYGVTWQGTVHTVAVTIINVALYACALVALIKARWQPSYTLNYLGHWLIFLWFGWYSFPYFGELP
jgi:hypothetical protein